jgi:hypothetical protein
MLAGNVTRRCIVPGLHWHNDLVILVEVSEMT